jgi:hypothetical protein
MPKLLIGELARGKGINLSQLQRKADITVATARRYWYGTRDGKRDGEALEELHIPTMMKIASVLGVKLKELISDEDRKALYLATR